MAPEKWERFTRSKQSGTAGVRARLWHVPGVGISFWKTGKMTKGELRDVGSNS